MNENEGFLSELTPSYKFVLIMQAFACYILVAVIANQFGWLWGAVAFAVDTLKDCFVVTAMISTSRANAISAERLRKQQEQRNRFSEYEGRLLDRGEMSVAPAPTRPFDSTELPSPEEYGR